MNRDFRYIDTHAHLNLSAFADDVDGVARTCAEKDVAVINIGTKQSTSEKAVALATKHPNCYAIVGLHPIQIAPAYHDSDELGEGATPFQSHGEEFDKEVYRPLTAEKRVVAIGECGLDYYNTLPGSYEMQERNFITQIELANEAGLPLMIHTRGPKPGEESPTGRSVYEDVYQILAAYAKVPFNVHFYAGTVAEAERLFSIGGTVSFTGVITFKTATTYQAVVRAVPLENIHAETDCPYVAPVPHRGQRAEPWMVEEVYKKIAELKNLGVEAVREQLIQNAVRQYKL